MHGQQNIKIFLTINTRDFQMVDGIEFYFSLHLGHLQNNCKEDALKTSLSVCSVLSWNAVLIWEKM
jgi:hypothetical protein